MTNTHYLLLTDEERVLYERLAEGLPESARMFAAALIAARAENKRKDEVIAELRKELVSLSGEYASALETYGLADTTYLREMEASLRALLQSEKERCPVHDFVMPCLGCAELALRVGVDEQEQSEKGGE